MNNNNIRHLYSTLSWRSKRFTTLCGGLCQAAYWGANCSHAVHNLIRENSRVHRCLQDRIIWSTISKYQNETIRVARKALTVWLHYLVICILWKLEYLWNKKRCLKRVNSIFFSYRLFDLVLKWLWYERCDFRHHHIEKEKPH